MERKIARFEKVSFEQFKHDYVDCFGNTTDSKIKEIYDNIKLPKRATTGSAGYDFFIPFDISISKHSTKIPTGIRCFIEDGYVLQAYPRSGFGFKYRVQLDNTVGIIDSDYYNAENEGHIMAKLTADSKNPTFTNFTVNQGTAFMQGILCQYFLTYDDETDGVRVGGLGSTTK